MAFCGKCGRENAPGTQFCGNCGAALTASITPQQPPAPTGTGLAPNVAGLLCYALGWITGLVFFFIEKDKYVRFHAVQSIIVFGSLQILQFLIGRLAMLSWGMLGLMSLVNTVIWVAELAVWILCMVKAYQGARFHLPIAGDMADKYAA
jgi:uncharacterized membrane protein